MAEVNSKPGRKTTEEFEENPNNLLEFPTHLDGGHEHGTHSSNSTDLIPENDDDMVGHASTLHDELQQKIDLLQEKLQQKENEIQQLLAELGRLEFLECREKRIEKSSRAHLGEQSKSSTVDGASCALTDVKENLLHWTGPPQELSKLNLLKSVAFFVSVRVFRGCPCNAVWLTWLEEKILFISCVLQDFHVLRRKP